MDQNDVELLRQKNYVLSPDYGYFSLSNYKGYELCNIYADDLAKIVHFQENNFHFLFKAKDSNNVKFVKLVSKYHITPNDLILAIDHFIKNGDDIEKIIGYTLQLTGTIEPDELLFTPNTNSTNYIEFIDDLNFRHEDTIVFIVTNFLNQCLNDEILEQQLELTKKAIIELIQNIKLPLEKKKLSDDVISFVVNSLCSFPENVLTPNVEYYINDQLNRLVDQKLPLALTSLGYSYYEGSHGFPLDMQKAEKYLSMAYEITLNPDLTRPLGYINYYGRNNNGVPNKEKAFQYFSIGHFAGLYYESTYKLADCFYHGYGVPVSKQAAFNLVASIYQKVLDVLRNGDYCGKFADVALRLGNYFRNGDYVRKSLPRALDYYLQAAIGIKTRISEIDYVGDKGVASTICKSVLDLKKELKIPDRIIKNGGYQFNKFENQDTFYNGNISWNGEFLHLSLTFDNDNNEFISFSDYGYCDLTNRAEFDIKLKDDYIEEYADATMMKLDFQKDKILLVVLDEDGNDINVNLPFDYMIYYPDSIKSLKKEYFLADVTFNPNGKIYQYLLKNKTRKLQPGDSILVNGKNVNIIDIRQCYEDELPLPLDKMSSI